MSEEKAKGQMSTRETPYVTWMRSQDIPIIEGYGVTNLQEHPLKTWGRTGVPTSFVHMKGMEGITGMYVMEIPPGGSTTVDKHLYEKVVYVMKGEGETEYMGPGEATNAVNWKEGSLFAIPLNTTHRIVNKGKEPAFLVATNTAPLAFDLYYREDFIYGTDKVFDDRYDGRKDYFELDKRSKDVFRPGWIWETNFIPDARAVELPVNERRGSGYLNIQFEICENSLIGHFTNFPTGRYTKAHYHGGGAILTILSSEGYSLMWPNDLGPRPFADGKGDKVVRVDWKEGSVFSPPTNWFHQHFNVTEIPALQMALRNGSAKHPFGVRKAATRGGVSTSIYEGGTQIEYEDEDPEIRRIFDAETAKHDVKVDMPRFNG